MPHLLRALEIIRDEDHRMRFLGLSTFSKDGLEQKLITALVLMTMESKGAAPGFKDASLSQAVMKGVVQSLAEILSLRPAGI